MKEPKIRFKGFSGEWETSPFYDIANRVSASASTYYYPGVEFEDVNAGEGTLNKDVTKKKIVKIGKLFTKGDVLFGKLRPYLKNILLTDFSGVAVGDFWVLRPKAITSELLYILTNSQEFMRVANISSGSKMPRADWNLVSSSSFVYPKSKAEQQSIASYFTNLDSLIQSTAKKIESLKQIKAASLQSMFPQEGETKPRVRFKGFEGEWEKPTIGDIFEIRNGYTPSKEVKQYWEGGTIPWFRMEDIRENGGVLKDSIQHITHLGIKGTGLFEKNSIILATTATIGVHAMLIADSLANQQFTNFSIRKSLREKYDNYFVYYSFFGIDEWSKKNTNSGGLISVNVPFLLKESFFTPTIAEQQAIVSYFTNLDNQISLQTQRLEKLKQIKSACLDNMFV